MEIIVLLFIIALGAIVKGALIYVLWNWLFIAVIGLALPSISFTLACIIGFILAVIFN